MRAMRINAGVDMESLVLDFVFGFLMACLCAGSILMPLVDLDLLVQPLGVAVAVLFLIGEGLGVDIFCGTPLSPLLWCFSFWIVAFSLGAIALSISNYGEPVLHR